MARDKRSKKPAKRLDKRTSKRLAKLAGRVLVGGGECTKAEAMQLAGCVLSQLEADEKKGGP